MNNIPEVAPRTTPVRGRPFPKGNPGRPKGARNVNTLAREALLEGQADAIIKKAVEMALDGDRVALKLCFERLLGARRDRPISLELPPIESASDAQTALAATLTAVGSGEITPAEATEISVLISTTIKVIETVEFDQRLSALEQAAQQNERAG